MSGICLGKEKKTHLDVSATRKVKIKLPKPDKSA